MRGILKFSGSLLISASLSALSLPLFETGFSLCAAAAETTPSGKVAKAENIVITEPFLTFKIKNLNVFGTPLSDSDLAALFDSRSSQPLSERLRQLSAETILIPELSVEKTGELGELFTYRDVKLEQVALGVVAKASAAEANFTLNGTQDHNLSGAYGKMQAEAFDMSLAAAIMTEVRTDASVPKKLLYKAFAVDGFTFADPKSGFALSAKEISGHDVNARPLRQPQSEPPEQGGAQKDPSLGDYVSMVCDAFDVGNVQMNSLHTTSKSGETSVTMVLDGLQINDLKAGRIAAADLKGLDLQSENTSVKLKDLAIGGLNLHALGLITDEQNAPARETKGPRLPELLSAANSLKLDGLEVIILPSQESGQAVPEGKSPNTPGDAKASAGTAEARGFTLAEGETRHSPMEESKPETFATSFEHLIVKLNPDLGQNGPGNALANLGYSKLDLSGTLELTLNPSRQLNISNFALSGIDLGALKASLIAENVTGDILSPDPAIAGAAFHQAILKHLDLRIDNFGLVSNVIAHLAEVQNKTIDETRESYETAAALIVPVLLGGGPPAKEIGSAMAKFIANPKSLHLIADAPSGLSLADPGLFQDPAALMKQLNVTVTADQ